jgi:hypothetical protein
LPVILVIIRVLWKISLHDGASVRITTTVGVDGAIRLVIGIRVGKYSRDVVE